MSDNSPTDENPGSSWVTFDDDKIGKRQNDNNPAVLDTESIQVTPGSSESSNTLSNQKSIAVEVESTTSTRADAVSTNPVPTVSAHPLNPGTLQNIPLNDNDVNRNDGYSGPIIRQGFANGDVIVTILPQNRTFPWVTPAQFRPELVPEELMAQGLTLTVEDYVHIMSQLVNDHRFTLYNMCYKRILMVWITLAFIILLSILFAGFQHLAMFGAGITWLMINAGAIFFCMWIKIKLNKRLEQCLSRINLQLMKHNILLGVDDRGKLSCHKVHLCFIYFDTKECLGKLHQLIEQKQLGVNEVNSAQPQNGNFIQTLDIEDPEIIITGATNTRVNKQQTKAHLLLARYSQRWAKLVIRGGLSLGIDAAERRSRGSVLTPVPPRHIATRQCLCQYIEDYLHFKPSGKCRICADIAELTPDFMRPY